MNSVYDVWFQDPRAIVQNMLKNPDFASKIDYAPYHEYDFNGDRQFQDFMSGDWVWKQAVGGQVETEITDN